MISGELAFVPVRQMGHGPPFRSIFGASVVGRGPNTWQNFCNWVGPQNLGHEKGKLRARSPQ